MTDNTSTAAAASDELDDIDDALYALAIIRPALPVVAMWGANVSVREREQLIRPAEAARLLGIHKATLYRLVTSGKLAKPIRISHRVSGWTMQTLMDWRDKQPGGVDAKAPRAPKHGEIAD